MDASRVLAGRPVQCGAVVADGGVNFSLFSKNAARVVLCLFDSPDAKTFCDTIEFDPEINKTGDVWHVFIKDLKAGALYLYRIDGPYNPPCGDRFNFNKYLFDPCAKAFTRGSVFRSYRTQRERGRAGIENGLLSDLSDFPKCVVVDDDDFDWQGDKPLARPLSDTIIYEAHVKGFTFSSTSGVQNPGTYRGFIEKIPYLTYLGVTAVELMPIFEFDEAENERVNPRTGQLLTNYWGYNTIGFFAPKTSYAADTSPGGAVREFKELVRELHRAGIEVILDVVYNHTAEGNEHGPTFSFRGIENGVYYMLPQTQKQYYADYSGCGNTVNANHPAVSEFILASLRHWVVDMHVDGFRFDLATILSRSELGHLISSGQLPYAIAEDPLLAKTKIIAEPWDAGDGYAVGSFAGGRWCEWNGKFRDDMRRFIRGDDRCATEAATRMTGSSDLYKANGRSPTNSVNYITSHDGFTMYDLVSYNVKHNEENGEGNRDGSDDNFSYNNGFEGDSTNPKIVSVRRRKIKNFLTCLFLSQGTPMLLSGDEMMRTQRGNNNAYCQDNETSWIDWHDCDKNRDILLYTKTLIELRKAYSLFRRNTFFADSSEITWYDANGKNPDWAKLNRFLAFKVDESVGGIGVNEIYFAINTDIYDLTITLPSPASGNLWCRIADTSIDGEDALRKRGDEELLSEQHRYVLPSDSLVLLISKQSF